MTYRENPIPQPPDKALRVGIIGCGRMARHHVRFLRQVAGAEVAGLADSDVASARRLGQDCGVTACYDSHLDLLESSNPDVVHILTPPQHHFAQALAAIERGVHVLLEKPCALHARDVEILYARAEERGVLLCPDFLQLFNPNFMSAAALVDSGQLGRVVHVECRLSLDLDGTELNEARRLHWSYCLPAGILHNNLTHPLYLVMRWVGRPTRIAVDASSNGSLAQGLTDHYHVLLGSRRCTGSVVLSGAIRPECYYVQIFCEKGIVTVDFQASMFTVNAQGGLPRSITRALKNFRDSYRLGAWGIRNIVSYARGRLVPYQGLQELIPRFYSSIRQGTAPPVARELALAVSEVEERVAESAGKACPVVVDRSSTQIGVSRKEKVVVTGAAGYVGREVVRQLVAHGYYVRAFVRDLSRTETIEGLGVELLHGDVRDLDSVTRACEGMDIVVHLAAGMRGSAQFVVDCAVDGTKNVAQASAACGVRRVLYMSSMAVYDFTRLANGDAIKEESALEGHPELRGAYSLAKRRSEDIALAHLNDAGASWMILRPSVIVGRGQDPCSPLGPRLGSLLICPGTPGKNVRIVHVEDVAAAMVKLIETPPTQGKIYTLSHPGRLTQRQYIASAVRPVSKGKLRVVYLPYWISLPLALAARLALRIVGKSGVINASRLAYLFRDVQAGSDAIHKATGWQPRKDLLRDQADEAASMRLPGTPSESEEARELAVSSTETARV